MSDSKGLPMKKTTYKSFRTWIWLMLCLGSFDAGYWLNKWASDWQARARLAHSLSWAIEQGLLTVNGDRLRQMQSK
jgi:hypothetical protein